MSLRVIFGSSGSGKTRYCLNEIKERINQGVNHPLVLLVPEQYTLQGEKDLITVLDSGGILKTEVLSFRRLAFRVLNEVGGITYPHLHSAGKSMAIFKILNQSKKDLHVFAKSANRQGFVNKISTLITEFKRYNITPEKIMKASVDLKDEDILKDKLIELHLVYSEFEKLISERYRDVDDNLTVAAKKMHPAKFLDEAEIWIDGFAGFSPQEYQIIAKLLLKAKRVNISLCTDSLGTEEYFEETDIFGAVKRAYVKLTTLCKELGVEMDSPIGLKEPLPRFLESPELAHLERNFYAYPYQTYPNKTKEITLFSSVSIFAEIEATARDIIRLTRDEGLRFRDIAVVTRNLNSYERLVEVIFAEYDIPCFLDRKIEIANHPLVRMILSMLDILNQNWSYEAVFSYLKTGLTGLDGDSIDRIENYVLACGIRGSRWTKEEEWNMSPDFLPDQVDLVKQQGLLKEINTIRHGITAPIIKFRGKTRRKKEATEFCSALFEFLCELDVPSRMEKIIDQFKEEGQLDIANEYSQVWNIIMEVFDQVVEVMGDEKLGLEDFANILKIGFGEYQVGLIPASLDQVLVGSVERSKSHEIKALYILGVNDGVFPSSNFEEGILSDQDRSALRNKGIEMANDTRAQVFDEQYLVYRALTTPGKRLRLSWPIADQEGRSMRPSIIISRLRKIFPDLTEFSDIDQAIDTRADDKVKELDLLTAKSPAFREMVRAIRQKADGKDISSMWENVYRWFSVQKDWKDRCGNIQIAFSYKNIAQSVSKGKVASLFGNPIYASVSRLERYTSCPFSFYVQYGLGAKERKIYRLTPPDVGTFMHAIIERFSHLVAEQGISWRDFDRDWCAQRISEIVDEMLEGMQGSGLAASKRYTALAIRLKRVVTRAVWMIAEHIRRSSFEPIGYEIGFGDNAELPSITLELESGELIKLTGRIDRVDALKTEEGTYLRIIDYKSGSKDFKLADAYYGLQVQLLTYLDALWENPGLGIEGPVLPGGVLYFKIDDPIVKLKGTEEEIEQAIMKELKMRGLLLADVRLTKEMDRTMERNSLIIPASLNKDGQIGRYSAVASLEHFKILRNYLRKLLQGLGEEIIAGKMDIHPYKKKNTTSCKFCNFTAVCQFDPSLKENSYRLLHEPKDEEIWKLMGEEQTESDRKGEGEE